MLSSANIFDKKRKTIQQLRLQDEGNLSEPNLTSPAQVTPSSDEVKPEEVAPERLSVSPTFSSAALRVMVIFDQAADGMA